MSKLFRAAAVVGLATLVFGYADAQIPPSEGEVAAYTGLYAAERGGRWRCAGANPILARLDPC
jgi:hypothetical protein